MGGEDIPFLQMPSEQVSRSSWGRACNVTSFSPQSHSSHFSRSFLEIQGQDLSPSLHLELLKAAASSHLSLWLIWVLQAGLCHCGMSLLVGFLQEPPLQSNQGDQATTSLCNFWDTLPQQLQAESQNRAGQNLCSVPAGRRMVVSQGDC